MRIPEEIQQLAKADMSAMQGMRMKNPVHPGGFVKREIIEALGLSVTNAAQVLGVTRAALSAKRLVMISTIARRGRWKAHRRPAA